jgi:hypothetical protein
MLEECRTLLDGISVQATYIDSWQWGPDIHDGYTVRGAYHILTNPVLSTLDETSNLIWHKQVPLKVSIVAWRLLKDRLPTRINLARRGIVQAEGAVCVAGCGIEESAAHVFIHCNMLGSLWQHIRAWIGVEGVDPSSITDHFIQFIHYTGPSKARRSFLQLLWLLGIWIIWSERNNRVFNNVETPIVQLLDKVKFHSLWWMKANNAKFVYGLQRWWSDPLICLGID